MKLASIQTISDIRPMPARTELSRNRSGLPDRYQERRIQTRDSVCLATNQIRLWPKRPEYEFLRNHWLSGSRLSRFKAAGEPGPALRSACSRSAIMPPG